MRQIISGGRRQASKHQVLIDALENRRLFAAGMIGGQPGTVVPAYAEIIGEPISIGTSKLIDITFTAASGRKTTISVHGAQAAITFSGTNVPLLAKGHGFFPNGSIETVDSILITDAVPGKASLSEKSAYGTGLFEVGSITGGDLSSVNMPDVTLTGSMALRSVSRLTLGSISGAAVSIAKSVGNAKLIGNLTGSFSAANIGGLSALEVLQANIATTSGFNRGGLAIGSITASYGIQQSNIFSSGNIGSVTAGFIQNSVITAAAELQPAAVSVYPTKLVPQYSTVFTSSASIRSIRILPTVLGNFFSNSVIAARTISSANLGQITGGGGIGAHSIGSFSAIGPSGQLDSITFHLGSKSLRTSTALRAELSKLQVPFSQGAGLQDDTMFYNFELNILR